MSEGLNDTTAPISINITDVSSNNNNNININININTDVSNTDNNNSSIQEQQQKQQEQEQEQLQKMIQLKQDRNELLKRELVQVVCRQTELTTDEARERLEKEQYNYMNVLNNYFGIKDTKLENSTSINQQIYGEIRTLMDTGAKGYRMEQERTEYIQKMNEQRTEALKAANNTMVEKIKKEM